jgi:hypothetical protein
VAHRTLWEEGRHPGALVVSGVAVALGAAVLLQLAVSDQLGWFFDLALVATCVAAALLVRPRDFFAVGVLPPLALGITVLTVAIVDRGAVARAGDGMLQAVVSGLAHHAIALALAYALTLAVLGLRQVALRNQGKLRRPHHEDEAATAAHAPVDDVEHTEHVPDATVS